MPNPRYSSGAPEFNAFLFEFLGREGNGRQLTVLSALARKGFDPWQEAARLSELPKEAATIAVAGFLMDIDEVYLDVRDMRSIVGRLVNRLPQHYDVPVRSDPAANVEERSIACSVPAAAPFRGPGK